MPPINSDWNVVNPETIRRRLNKLDEYLDFLETSRQYSLEAFRADPERYGSAERFLHLTIELLTDLANHVVADEQLGPVEQYRDLPRIFAEQGWVDESLQETWVQMIGFRNILVHEYLDVDRQIVYEVLQNHLDDFRRLRSVFARFL